MEMYNPLLKLSNQTIEESANWVNEITINPYYFLSLLNSILEKIHTPFSL